MRRDVDATTSSRSAKDSLEELSSHLSGVERICSEALAERDELFEALQAAEIRHEDESAAMQATIVDLRRQAAYWEKEAKKWQSSYSRVERDLLAFSQSVSMESPSKQCSKVDSVRGSDQSCPSATPTRSKTESVTSRSPKWSSPGRMGHYSDISTPGKQMISARACAETIPPRQIFIRRVQAVVHVKEETDGQDFVGNEDSSDELTMNGPQPDEIYGGVAPASPSPKSIKRTNVSGEVETSPTKRRRMSEG
ncbi:hypothetical protein B0H14DRAFT_2776975 [Mycena olivaceomarginata]|nr:hypothetical protein B0H14DRAFT_2776975 [Mycena olivaceomarginata]